MRRLIVGLLSATVAACGESGADNRTAANQAAAQPEAPAIDGNTNEAAEADANRSSPADNIAASAPAAAIPAVIQGRWGLVPADCTSTRGDAKGLLEISDRQLRFYESRGTLRQVVEADAGRIVADLDFTGEGQSWQRRMSLDAQDETLIRREQGADAMPRPLLYRRCEDR